MFCRNTQKAKFISILTHRGRHAKAVARQRGSCGRRGDALSLRVCCTRADTPLARRSDGGAAGVWSAPDRRSYARAEHAFLRSPQRAAALSGPDVTIAVAAAAATAMATAAATAMATAAAAAACHATSRSAVVSAVATAA